MQIFFAEPDAYCVKTMSGENFNLSKRFIVHHKQQDEMNGCIFGNFIF